MKIFSAGAASACSPAKQRRGTLRRLGAETPRRAGIHLPRFLVTIRFLLMTYPSPMNTHENNLWMLNDPSRRTNL